MKNLHRKSMNSTQYSQKLNIILPGFRRECKKANPCRETELERCIAKCREEFGPMKSQFAEYTDTAVTFIKETSTTISGESD